MSQAYSNPARITGLTDQQALHLDAWIVRTQSVERRGDAILAYTNPWGASERDKPGYWVKLTKRCYAYREHTGTVTVWRAARLEGKEGR